jgi:hypothetical protein
VLRRKIKGEDIRVLEGRKVLLYIEGGVGRSQLPRPLFGPAFSPRMFSKVYIGTKTPRDQGPGLVYV